VRRDADGFLCGAGVGRACPGQNDAALALRALAATDPWKDEDHRTHHLAHRYRDARHRHDRSAARSDRDADSPVEPGSNGHAAPADPDACPDVGLADRDPDRWRTDPVPDAWW
jgi:hypothetical protein